MIDGACIRISSANEKTKQRNKSLEYELVVCKSVWFVVIKYIKNGKNLP
jgi:hypothetical protein